MNTLGQWIWLMFWWFLFFAYLMILFQIVSDLFRDREVGGWAKAGWIIGLVFLPFLIALIYIIARGDGMAHRQTKAAYTARVETDNYIRQTAGSSAASSIADAKALLDAGVIDEGEFATLKAKALA